jgi:branched-chain amino acid transport system substrate-binding protein
MLLFEAIARAADKGTLKKDGVAEEMRKTDRDTLIGRVQFGANGDNLNFTHHMGSTRATRSPSSGPRRLLPAR